MARWLLLSIVMVFAFFIPGCDVVGTTTDSSVSAEPRSIDDCRYKIITSSRIYYTNSCEDDADAVTLHGYFSYENNQWKWVDFALEMNRDAYGKIEVIERGSEKDREPYYVGTIAQPGRTLELRTIAHWEGQGSKTMRFKATKAPWVINGVYKQTSKMITGTFQLTVYQSGDEYVTIPHEFRSGVQSLIMEDTGTFIIEVDSAGCDWWVRVGVE